MKKAQLENNLSALFGKFHKQIMGRGPTQIKTKIMEDMIIIRFISPNEPLFKHLMKSDKGQEILQRLKNVMFESTKAKLLELFQEEIECSEILHIYYDAKLDNQSVIIFTYKDNLEECLED